MMCVCLKNFTGNGEDFVRNQLIDGNQFAKVQVLITQRFLRPATQEEINSAVEEGEEAPPPKKKGGLKARRRKR